MKGPTSIYAYPQIYVTCRTPSARKAFYPNGPKVAVIDYQRILGNKLGKTNKGLELIQSYGLAQMTLLGKNPVHRVKERANYLWKNNIHSRLFVNAVFVIGVKASYLKPHVEQIQLKRLERDSIQAALKEGRISESDIGRYFHLFEKNTQQQQIEILDRLGVFTFKPGKSLENVFPRRAEQRSLRLRPRVLEPRPPIKKGQLDLLDRLSNKKK
jgi:hypothetical protein